MKCNNCGNEEVTHRQWETPSPRYRYEHDQTFRHIVDYLRQLMEINDSRTWTPTELREAAMLAAVMYEQTHIRPLMIDRNGEYIRP